jgi:hypothetical protein
MIRTRHDASSGNSVAEQHGDASTAPGRSDTQPHQIVKLRARRDGASISAGTMVVAQRVERAVVAEERRLVGGHRLDDVVVVIDPSGSRCAAAIG